MQYNNSSETHRASRAPPSSPSTTILMIDHNKACETNANMVSVGLEECTSILDPGSAHEVVANQRRRVTVREKYRKNHADGLRDLAARRTDPEWNPGPAYFHGVDGVRAVTYPIDGRLSPS